MITSLQRKGAARGHGAFRSCFLRRDPAMIRRQRVRP
jgi:hypothetical protein